MLSWADSLWPQEEIWRGLSSLNHFCFAERTCAHFVSDPLNQWKFGGLIPAAAAAGVWFVLFSLKSLLVYPEGITARIIAASSLVLMVHQSSSKSQRSDNLENSFSKLCRGLNYYSNWNPLKTVRLGISLFFECIGTIRLDTTSMLKS